MGTSSSLPDVPIFINHLKLDHMKTAETLKRAIIGIPMTNHAKLFLFGITGKDVCRMLKQKLSIGAGPRTRVYNRLKDTDFAKIEEKLDTWASDQNNMASDFRMEELAGSLGIRPYTMSLYFEKYLKKDFRTWKTGIRIELAKALLLSDDKSDVITIAESVGFRDKSNFHRQFKAYTGCTPAIWRKTGGHPELN